MTVYFWVLSASEIWGLIIGPLHGVTIRKFTLEDDNQPLNGKGVHGHGVAEGNIDQPPPSCPVVLFFSFFVGRVPFKVNQKRLAFFPMEIHWASEPIYVSRVFLIIVLLAYFRFPKKWEEFATTAGRFPSSWAWLWFGVLFVFGWGRRWEVGGGGGSWEVERGRLEGPCFFWGVPFIHLFLSINDMKIDWGKNKPLGLGTRETRRQPFSLSPLVWSTNLLTKNCLVWFTGLER